MEIYILHECRVSGREGGMIEIPRAEKESLGVQCTTVCRSSQAEAASTDGGMHTVITITCEDSFGI